MFACWVVHLNEIPTFPSFLSNSILENHGDSSCDEMWTQLKLQRSLQKIWLIPYLLLEDCSSEEGRQEIGESTSFGNNCKGPLCDPYQKIPDPIFLLGHELRWVKQQLEKDITVALLGIPVSTMLIFLAEIFTKNHIGKYFIILCMVLLG